MRTLLCLLQESEVETPAEAETAPTEETTPESSAVEQEETAQLVIEAEPVQVSLENEQLPDR